MTSNDEMFHDPDHPIWGYCVYLGPYSKEGRDYDLGVYVERQGCLSLAAVYGNEEGQYKSGEFLFNEEPLPFLESPLAVEACGRFLGREACRKYLNQISKRRSHIERLHNERKSHDRR